MSVALDTLQLIPVEVQPCKHARVQLSHNLLLFLFRHLIVKLFHRLFNSCQDFQIGLGTFPKGLAMALYQVTINCISVEEWEVSFCSLREFGVVAPEHGS